MFLANFAQGVPESALGTRRRLEVAVLGDLCLLFRQQLNAAMLQTIVPRIIVGIRAKELLRRSRFIGERKTPDSP